MKPKASPDPTNLEEKFLSYKQPLKREMPRSCPDSQPSCDLTLPTPPAPLPSLCLTFCSLASLNHLPFLDGTTLSLLRYSLFPDRLPFLTSSLSKLPSSRKSSLTLNDQVRCSCCSSSSILPTPLTCAESSISP